MPPGRIPPLSEAAFKREYFLIWMFTGAGCMILGLVVGPLLWHARYSWLPVIVGLGVYLFSLLLCRVVLLSVWRRPLVTPPVLYFSIPIGLVGFLVITMMSWLSSNFALGRRILVGLALSMGLLYAASLIWAIGVGIRRKKMGRIDTGR